MNMVREIKQYQAADGKTFNTREEAEQYAEMLKNPHFKDLQERIEKLESDIRLIRAKIAGNKRPSAIDPMNPYKIPPVMYCNQSSRDSVAGGGNV